MHRVLGCCKNFLSVYKVARVDAADKASFFEWPVPNAVDFNYQSLNYVLNNVILVTSNRIMYY